MRKIPDNLRKDMAADPFYLFCCRRREGKCSGRITWEHAFIYDSKQINEKWAIIPLCHYHHLGHGLDKNLNQHLALGRASYNDLQKYPKRNWEQLRSFLSQKYAH